MTLSTGQVDGSVRKLEMMVRRPGAPAGNVYHIAAGVRISKLKSFMHTAHSYVAI